MASKAPSLLICRAYNHPSSNSSLTPSVANSGCEQMQQVHLVGSDEQRRQQSVHSQDNATAMTTGQPSQSIRNLRIVRAAERNAGIRGSLA